MEKLGLRRRPRSRTLVRVTNPGPAPIVLRVEPWGEEFSLAVGHIHDLVFEGPDPADINVEVLSSGVTIHGWVGSVLNGQGPPVPSVPPGYRV